MVGFTRSLRKARIPDFIDPEEGLREYRMWVGKIASHWSLLERLIDIAIWAMAGTDSKHGACLTSQIQSSRNKLIAMEALAVLNGNSVAEIKRIRVFMNKMEGPARKRNRIIHDQTQSRTIK